jgi:hypothetical protein
MTKLFMPKVTTPSVPMKAPDAATPAVQAAADAERRRSRSGVAANMLTGSSGAASGPLGTTKLLGG